MNPHPAPVQGFPNLFKTEKPEAARLKSGEVTQVNELTQAMYETRVATLEKQMERLSNEFYTTTPKTIQRVYILEQRNAALEEFCGQIHKLDMAMIADIAIVQELIQKLKDLTVLEPEYPMPSTRRQRIEPLKPPPNMPAPPYAPPEPSAPSYYEPSAPPEPDEPPPA